MIGTVANNSVGPLIGDTKKGLISSFITAHRVHYIVHRHRAAPLCGGKVQL